MKKLFKNKKIDKSFLPFFIIMGVVLVVCLFLLFKYDSSSMYKIYQY